MVAVPTVLLLEGTVSPHPMCGGWGGEDVRLREAAGGSPSRDTAGIPAMLDPSHWQETRGVSRTIAEQPGNCWLAASGLRVPPDGWHLGGGGS